MTVLDASAILALLFREKGEDVVRLAWGGAVVSAVNLSEVIARLVRDGHDADRVAERLRAEPWEVVPFGEDAARETARLRPLTAHLGLSLGDRACLALALARGLPALTTDRTWAQLDIGVTIRLAR